MVAGALAAVLLQPAVRDYLLIRDLTAGDAAARRSARLLLRNLAASDPRTLRRLDDALSTGSDRRFAAVASLLRSLDAFDTPGRQGPWLDRLNAIELSESADAWTRWMIMVETLLDGRDNRYVRRALAEAAVDEAPIVRKLAAMLAARLAEDRTLAALLGDTDADVAAAAAMSIAAARRSALADAVMAMLGGAKDRERISAAAWASAQLEPAKAVGRIAKMTVATTDAALRDRLLHVLEQMPGERSAAAIGRIIARDCKVPGKNYPPAKAILAAGRLGLTGQAANVRYVLDCRGPADQLTEGHLLAALQAAEMLQLPVRREADRICRGAWGAGRLLLLMTAARVLGRQLDVPQGPGAPSREHCLETLRLAAAYVGAPQSQPASRRGEYVTTPLPSAAAAVALWLAGQDDDDKLVRNATAGETTLPGDYVAWHLSRAAPADRAFALGLKMLPAVGAPPGERVFNDNELSAGAMLLALSARTSRQKHMAAARIARRLEGTKGFYTAGALRCALLILGRRDQLDQVRRLLSNLAFPRRRVMTALCAAGDRGAIDWLLFNKYISDEDVVAMLAARGIGRVISAVAPRLGRLDLAAGRDLRLWQVRIMQSYWGVCRAGFRLGFQP